jgi:hypothetical protein
MLRSRYFFSAIQRTLQIQREGQTKASRQSSRRGASILSGCSALNLSLWRSGLYDDREHSARLANSSAVSYTFSGAREAVIHGP